MKRITIEIEDKVASEIKSGKKAIAIVDKQQLESMKDTESQVVGGFGTSIFTGMQTKDVKNETKSCGLEAYISTGVQTLTKH